MPQERPMSGGLAGMSIRNTIANIGLQAEALRAETLGTGAPVPRLSLQALGGEEPLFLRKAKVKGYAMHKKAPGAHASIGPHLRMRTDHSLVPTHPCKLIPPAAPRAAMRRTSARVPPYNPPEAEEEEYRSELRSESYRSQRSEGSWTVRESSQPRPAPARPAHARYSSQAGHGPLSFHTTTMPARGFNPTPIAVPLSARGRIESGASSKPRPPTGERGQGSRTARRTGTHQRTDSRASTDSEEKARPVDAVERESVVLLEADWEAKVRERAAELNREQCHRKGLQKQLLEMCDEYAATQANQLKWEQITDAAKGGSGAVPMSEKQTAQSGLNFDELVERVEAAEGGQERCLIARQTLVYMQSKLVTKTDQQTNKIAQMRTELAFMLTKLEEFKKHAFEMKNQGAEVEVRVEQELDRHETQLLANEMQMEGRELEFKQCRNRLRIDEDAESKDDQMRSNLKEASVGEVLARKCMDQQRALMILHTNITQNRAKAAAMERDLHRLMRVAGRSNIADMLQAFTQYSRQAKSIHLQQVDAERKWNEMADEKARQVRLLSGAKDRACMTAEGEAPLLAVQPGDSSEEKATEMLFQGRQREAERRVTAATLEYTRVARVLNRMTTSLYNLLDWMLGFNMPAFNEYKAEWFADPSTLHRNGPKNVRQAFGGLVGAGRSGNAAPPGENPSTPREPPAGTQAGDKPAPRARRISISQKAAGVAAFSGGRRGSTDGGAGPGGRRGSMRQGSIKAAAPAPVAPAAGAGSEQAAAYQARGEGWSKGTLTYECLQVFTEELCVEFEAVHKVKTRRKLQVPDSPRRREEGGEEERDGAEEALGELELLGTGMVEVQEGEPDIRLLKKYMVELGLQMENVNTLMSWASNRSSPFTYKPPKVVACTDLGLEDPANFRIALDDPFKESLAEEATRRSLDAGRIREEDSGTPPPKVDLKLPGPPDKVEVVQERTELKVLAHQKVAKEEKRKAMQQMMEEEGAKPEFMKRREATRHQTAVVDRLFSGQRVSDSPPRDRGTPRSSDAPK